MSEEEYSKFRNVAESEPTDFGSAFFQEAGLILQKEFEYKNPWGFTDVDCMTERNGRLLLIERKLPPVNIFQRGLTAQKKAIEGVTRRTKGNIGIVVWADKGFDNIAAYRVCIDGVWSDIVDHNTTEGLLLVIHQWGQLVTVLGPLEKWNPRWYPEK
jgi:hypothetical protein